METVGQDVDEKAADELVDVERDQLVAVVGLGPVILRSAPSATAA
jgi:hypothetical protein